VQHLFVEGTGSLEGSPQADLECFLFTEVWLCQRDGNEFFDECDKMFLEVVEYGFFARRVQSFFTGRAIEEVLCQLDACEVI
jgi:hypothetical protein